MLVTDDRLVAGRDLVALARAAEAGGVTAIQLRLKQATPREQVELARALVAALRVPVLVNDRPDVAIAAGAAGVHLGTDDLPPALARRIAPQSRRRSERAARASCTARPRPRQAHYCHPSTMQPAPGWGGVF